MNITENLIQVNGGYRMYYRKKDANMPCIVMMHGIPTNSFLWMTVMPHLMNQATIIAPDLIGYGKSDRGPASDLTLPKQAGYIVQLLNSIGIKKAHFIGHDLGGGIAQILAVNYPQVVESIMVIDGVCLSNWPLPGVVALRYPVSPEFEPSPLFIERMIRGGVLNQQSLTLEMVRAFVEPFATPNGPAELQQASFALEHHQTEELVPSLMQLNIPVTILYGQYDRYLVPYWGLRLQEIIPNSVFRVLPNCSHFSMIDNPQLVAEEILMHLARVRQNRSLTAGHSQTTHFIF